MKRVITAGLFLMLLHLCHAQTNVFPADGNVGVGTTAPENSESWDRVFEIKGTANAKALVSSNNIITGVWSHNTGYYGAPAGGIAGTYTNHPYSIITNGTSRMVIATSGNVGIGTQSPDNLLTLDMGSRRDGINILSDGNQNAYSDLMFSIKTTTNVPANKPTSWIISSRKDGYFSGDNTGNTLEFYAIASSGYFAPLLFKSNGDVILAGANQAVNGNVGIGTVTPGEKLSVNGNIRAKEIKVEAANWPDYVFRPAYTLMPLDQIENFIKQNGHLPEMPAAKEVAEKGIEVGANQAVLLKKIEELTLHLIAMEKKIKEQDTEIKKLKNKQ